MDMIIYEKPMKIELKGDIVFVNGEKHPHESRTLEQMRPVLMGDHEGNAEVYHMFRDVYKDNGIRYDITVIPAAEMGDECPKTHGHYHPVSDDGVEYCEIYQVLHGSALFILQKKNRNGSVDVAVVDAKEKDVVLMPPGYGHVTINKGEDTLVLANLVYSNFAPLYKEYKENRGAAYYYLKDHELAQNTNYIVHRNERLSPSELNARYGIDSKDLLVEFYADPHKFAFLEKPGML